MYDLIIIGAGPGGYPTALKAAALGKKVAVVEKDHLGGTCLNRGCIPTKTLLHATELYRACGEAARFGVICKDTTLCYDTLWAHKDQTVHALRSGIAQHFTKSKVDLIQGIGCIVGEHAVEVTNEGGARTTYAASHIMIATGSAPAMPPIEGITLPNVLNSNDILEQNKLGTTTAEPFGSVIIIGGGVIGMEMATIYSNIGCSVTVLEAMPRILAGFDKEIAQNLKMILKKRNVTIITSAFVQKIEVNEDNTLTCTYTEKEKEKVVTAAGILVSTGRKATTEGLFSEALAKAITFQKGYIETNCNFQTGIPNIYAIGDVRGRIQLAHMATAEGSAALAHMFDLPDHIDFSAIPSCVYTEPEIASVGLSAEDAATLGIETLSGKHIMSANGKSVLTLQERGFIKLIADKETRVLLGGQMMCARATDMIGEVAVAIANKLTIEQFNCTVRAHPTFEEGIGEALAQMK